MSEEKDEAVEPGEPDLDELDEEDYGDEWLMLFICYMLLS